MRITSVWTYFLVLLVVKPERRLDALPAIQEGAPDDDLVHEPEVEPQSVHAHEIYPVAEDLRLARGQKKRNAFHS